MDEAQVKTKQRWVPILFLTFSLAFFVYAFFTYAKVPMDSDFASLTLEAADIKAGNILLRDWNLTGATFLFSELPFYLIGVLVFGVDTKAYLLASALMLWQMFTLGYFLLPSPKKVVPTLLYIFLVGLPSTFYVYSARSHVGIFVILFAALICLKKAYETYRRDGKIARGALSVYAILSVLGGMSDMFILTTLLFPVILFCLVELFSRKSDMLRFSNTLLGFTAGSVLLGKLFEKGYLLIGGADLNDRVGNIVFTEFEQIPRIFWKIIDILLKLFNANITDRKIFTLGTLFVGLRLLLVGFGIVLVVRTLWNYFRRHDMDFVNLMLSLGIVIQLLFLTIVPFIFTDQCARYYSYFPIAFVILILREMDRSDWLSVPALQGKTTLKTLFLIGGLILFIGTIRPLQLQRVPTPQDRIATYLEEQGLTHGFTDFWYANHVSVASNGKVALSAINCLTVNGVVAAHPFYWFNKNAWYDDPDANFVVVSPYEYQDLTVENVIRYIGEPSHVEKFEDSTILIYSPGIDQMLTKRAQE